MRRVIRNEDGAAIVVAMLVMLVFLVTGFTALAFVDVQQRESGRERTRESSFALSEGALSAQIYTLSKSTGWPAVGGQAYEPCSSGGSADARCPQAAEVAKSFTTADYTGSEWVTTIHDNGRVLNEVCTNPPQPGSNFYDDVVTRQQPARDANCDGFLWVRSEAQVADRTRVLVALVRAEQLAAEMPRYGVVAGKFDIGPSGNQTYIDAGSPNKVIVRCPLSASDCASYDPGSVSGHRQSQVDGVVESQPGFQSGLSPETIERLRDTARANGTYYTGGCVPSLAGALVFIEVANCPYGYNPPGNGAWNSSQTPGVLIVGEGHIQLSGNATFYGLIYHVNKSDEVAPGATPDGTVLSLGPGATRVIGGVLIDGRGGLFVGSNHGGASTHGNLVFDPRAFDAVKVYGTAGIVQNSFREIQPAASLTDQ